MEHYDIMKQNQVNGTCSVAIGTQSHLRDRITLDGKFRNKQRLSQDLATCDFFLSIFKHDLIVVTVLQFNFVLHSVICCVLGTSQPTRTLPITAEKESPLDGCNILEPARNILGISLLRIWPSVHCP